MTPRPAGEVPDAKPTVEPEQDEQAQQKACGLWPKMAQEILTSDRCALRQAWLATRQKLLSFRKLVEDMRRATEAG